MDESPPFFLFHTTPPLSPTKLVLRDAILKSGDAAGKNVIEDPGETLFLSGEDIVSINVKRFPMQYFPRPAGLGTDADIGGRAGAAGRGGSGGRFAPERMLQKVGSGGGGGGGDDIYSRGQTVMTCLRRSDIGGHRGRDVMVEPGMLLVCVYVSMSEIYILCTVLLLGVFMHSFSAWCDFCGL